MAEFEGTFLCVVTLPLPWPPKVDVVLETATDGDSTCTIVATAEGRLSARAYRKTGESQVIESRPIEVLSGQGVVFLSIVWAEDRRDIGLGQGDKVTSLIGDGGAVQIATGWRNEPAGLNAWEAPEAHVKCAERMKWRAAFFRARPLPNKVERSLEDQVLDLCDSLRAIEHLVEHIASGSQFLLPDVAARLRGLLYWRGKRPGTYDPLLLRLADAAHLPLPVFTSFPLPDDDGELSTGLTYRSFGPDLRVVGGYTSESLVDLQDWLESTVVHEVGGPSGKSGKGGQAMTPLRLIEERANHLGSSHFSRWTTTDLDLLRQQEHLAWDAASIWLLCMAKAVHALGDYVLSNICHSATPLCHSDLCRLFKSESPG